MTTLFPSPVRLTDVFFAAEKDKTKGMGSGWERFDFNKDAPLDDEEIEGELPVFLL